jgi:hypothetical protein
MDTLGEILDLSKAESRYYNSENFEERLFRVLV